MAKKYYDENGNEVKVKQKRGGCLKWLLYGFMAIILLGACGALLDDGEESITENKNESEKEEVSETVENDSEEDSEPVEEEYEDTEDEEEEDEYDFDTEDKDEDEEYGEGIHKNDDGVMIFDRYEEISLSINSLVAKFSTDMADELKEHKDDIDNGAVFRLAGPLTDEYGNETKKYVISVYYTQDTIDKINVDNWPLDINKGLYKTADGVIIHPALRDNKYTETKVYDGEQPDEYTYSVNTEYEE